MLGTSIQGGKRSYVYLNTDIIEKVLIETLSSPDLLVENESETIPKKKIKEII